MGFLIIIIDKSKQKEKKMKTKKCQRKLVYETTDADYANADTLMLLLMLLVAVVVAVVVILAPMGTARADVGDRNLPISPSSLLLQLL